jgi:hypothetical protein
MVPVVGDAFDFVWKSNKRNMDLIRERATGRGKGTRSDWIFLGVILFSLVAILALSIIVSLFLIGYALNEFLNEIRVL